MEIQIKIGIGEAIDRGTILQIKLEKILDEAKLKNITKELEYLEKLLEPIPEIEGHFGLAYSLGAINAKLWDIEDKLRIHEKNEDFGEEFIELARQVYKLNDRRAEIKKELNKLYKSEFIEEKSY